MIDITWNGTGLFAIKRGKAPDLVMRATSVVLQLALMEWASGKGQVRSKLADRFGPGAFAKYGFTPRNRGYQNQQRKAMGQPRPYFSPRRMNYAKLATGLATGNALAALRGLQEISRNAHTATLVQRPGGYLISGTNGSRTTRVKITFPGARILNRLGAKGDVYRKEFRDLNRGSDLAKILMRADDIFAEQLEKQLSRLPLRRITS